MTNVTIALPAELAQALIDMAEYGADEKLYWVDQEPSAYDLEEETAVRRLIVQAREAVAKSRLQIPA